MKHFVGVDIGGTRIKAGLVSANMKLVRESVAWLEPSDKSEDGLVRRVAAVIREVSEGVRPVLVGVGIPGVIDRSRGVVSRSPNFPEWLDFPVQRRLSDLTGHAVVIDNDANCVIVGEAIAGAGAGTRSLIGLTLGTGVGGGIFLDGALWRGVNGMGGELGHVVADPAGPPCTCGGRGCLEMYPSVNGLRVLCRAQPVAGVDADANDLPEQLAAAVGRGDWTARAHFATAGQALGRVLGSLLNIFDVKKVVLAGGVAATFPLMQEACTTAIRGASFPEIAAGVEIVQGTLAERAGIIGAAFQWQAQPGHD